jgi:hypothetical protein
MVRWRQRSKSVAWFRCAHGTVLDLDQRDTFATLGGVLEGAGRELVEHC